MHAKDLAKAIYMIPQSNKLGKIYNAGVEKPNTIREITETIANHLNIKFSISSLMQKQEKLRIASIG